MKMPRYPAVVYDVPRCYDPKPNTYGKCDEKEGYDVYLRFKYLANSDSEFWRDITAFRNNNNPTTDVKVKSWRVSIFKASTGEYLDGTYHKDKKTDWRPIDNENDYVRLKTIPDGGNIPREVLLRADFEFCSSDADKCDTDSSAQIVGRSISFLMHEFPEPDDKALKNKATGKKM